MKTMVEQRRNITLLWEITQSIVALSITIANVVAGILMVQGARPSSDYPEVLKGAFYLVIGFYFSRTNLGNANTQSVTRAVALVGALLFSSIAFAQSAVPIGANVNWETDIWLRNLSDVSVTQNVGTLNQRLPDGSIRTIRTDITLAPRETRRLANANLNFDAGLWILPIDPRLEASVFLYFKNTPIAFELLAIQNAATVARIVII